MLRTDGGWYLTFIRSSGWLLISLTIGCPPGAVAGTDNTQVESPPVNATAPAVDPAAAHQALADYRMKLNQRIIQSWLPPREKKPATTVVSFTVHSDGAISDIQLLSSSGDTKADEDALETIKSTAPADALPPGAPPEIVITLKFDYEKVDPSQHIDNNLEAKLKLVEDNPKDPRYAYDYARALRLANQPEKAISYLQKAVDLNFAGCEPLVEMGLCYKKLREPTKSETVLRQAIELDPRFALAYKALGDLLYENKRWEEAGSVYSSLLKLQPHGPLAAIAELRIQLCERHGKEEPDD